MSQKIEIKSIPLASLKPYANNARTHSEQQVEQLAKSIQQFGFNNPILVQEDLTVIAGHGRLAAAQKLGMTEVPTITLKHLTPEQTRAYVLADNKLALNAGWDNEMLKAELLAIQEAGEIDLSLIGFDDNDLKYLITDVGDVEQLCAHGERHLNINERKDGYDKSIIRQIILVYGIEEYNAVIDALADYAEKFGLANNAEVINHLLESNGYQVNSRQVQGD
jgi:ParB-like chromosome segregation protein Spo0J